MKTPALVYGIVACFVTVVTACTLVALFGGEDVDLAAFLTSVLGFTGTTLALLATLAKVGQVDGKMADVNEKVDYLANGGTDAKIRAGIADVLRPDLIADDAADQIEADRAHRAAGPSPLA